MVHRKDTNRFRLDIFGSGPLESLLRSRLRALDLEGLVEIHGFVERRTLVAAMLAADIFCVPSRYEACPMVLMEGMALGKPVIAFNLPFSVEFLRGYEALLASSEADYADKLSFLIKSRPERIALGSKLKERAKNFSPTKMAEAYKTIYEELIRR
jgi:glycosyltransferase involved in cell wall biosynthesis